MTYAQQKKIERLRAKVVDLYNAADKQQGTQRGKTLLLWLKASATLDAYQDKVFN